MVQMSIECTLVSITLIFDKSRYVRILHHIYKSCLDVKEESIVSPSTARYILFSLFIFLITDCIFIYLLFSNTSSNLQTILVLIEISSVQNHLDHSIYNVSFLICDITFLSMHYNKDG